MKTKECNKCGKVFPATTEYFYKNRTKKDGLTSSCAECRREYTKKYYEKNKDKIKKCAQVPRSMRDVEYRYYEGDEVLAEGTIHEISKQIKETPTVLAHYATPAYTNRKGKRLIRKS
jgi:hypothetical protein